ncbi:hypothetical protein C8Q74DRAFT_1441671 [Fomes fomentarius]|nr:hypothetical protein C8Q74DRAFT_1441671 [Fomes fomentarius]
MTSTINNNDPLVHYSPNGWEPEPRFGGIHAPIVNNPTAANLTLEFDGTGVVVGFLNNGSPFNVRDLLRCAVDTPDIPLPTPLNNAQTSTQVTLCAITSLPSTHHTLRVHPGEGANNNPLISGFVVFSDSASTRAVTPIAVAPPTQQSSASPKDTSSPRPSHTSQSTLRPSSITSGSSPKDTLSPQPSHTSPSAPRPSTMTSRSTSAPPTNSPLPAPSIAFPSSPPTLPSSTASPWQDPSPTSQPQPSPTHAPSASPHTALISTSIVGGVVLLVVVISLLLSRLWKRRRHEGSAQSYVGTVPTSDSAGADAEADPAQTSENTFIAPSPTIRRLSGTCAPLAKPSSQQAHLTMASITSSVSVTDGHRTPPPAGGSSDSLDTPSSHTRLVHGEVLSTAWYAPKELQSHAQSLLRGFSAQRRGASAMRDVDSGLRVHDEATLPPPYTPD